MSPVHGLEGVVGKPLSSRYHPGGRGDWIKVKNIRHQEVIICGWTTGEGRRANMIGSLLPGVYDDDRLRYVGNVGTGFTEAMLADLMRQLAPLAAGHQPVRHAGAAPVCPRRALGGTPAGRRGRVHRVDRRGEHAAPELARASRRQEPGRRTPRTLSIPPGRNPRRGLLRPG